MTNPDREINEEAETKAIEKWLRMVDRPLAAKKRDKKLQPVQPKRSTQR